MSDGVIRPRRALISVSDRTALVPFARLLAREGVEILSTGGTGRTLANAGIPVRQVSDHTGFPEIMGGRVKTLHPAIHGGILADRSDPAHEAAMVAHGIAPIDMVVVNLYPFEKVAASGAEFAHCIENIDIGGPSMVRSAAKNHAHVAVLTDPSDYADVENELDAHGGTTLALRRRLAATAFARTGAYDAAIADWFSRQLDIGRPRHFAFGGTLAQDLRYGENPHQTAAFYIGGPVRPGVATATQLQGKELSYNNINDTEAAFELVAEFERPAVAIIKHANPCGVAVADTLAEAYKKALAADPVSAYGGIIACNRPLDRATAEAIGSLFAEVVIAPAVEPDAAEVMARKTQLRLLSAGGMPDPQAAGMTVRGIGGGYLIQSRDAERPHPELFKTATTRAPSAAETDDMVLAMLVAKHTKSNAIVLAKGGMTVGIGGGQTSRVDAARQAVQRAHDFAVAAGEPASRAQGAVAASDAFFPFADGLQLCLEAGVTAVIQPGGSKRDAEVIAAADAAGAAMVFTGIRHFRH